MEHKDLAAGRWFNFTLCEQMANVGSEVERAIIWGNKGNPDYKQRAFYRALELLDLTIRDPKNRKRLKEVVRVREMLADFFAFNNEYNSTEKQWQQYFFSFTYASRLHK
ncbi:MAG: hypothetical protein JW915_11715, partial [Chitinispirillaceae bacterium]|nr:hypothetical protein [Chitinispirillaceae bacterium]